MNVSKSICLILSVLMLSSCSIVKRAFKDNADESGKVVSVEAMYNDAIGKLEKGRYEGAIETFEEVERTYPYSKWATKSQIMSAYASYKDEKYDDALVTLERFTKLHPGNQDIAYAYYLRSLSFYEQISDVTKDQGYSVYAGSALREVIARFPSSKYANDAKLKLDLVNDHLAGKEVDVGRFYLKQGNAIAAINRFQKVIAEYETTAHVPEALHRLVEAYTMLGVREEAMRYAAVLGYNFPENDWYKRSYQILEGKKLTKLSKDDKEGRWYDFANWKDLRLKKPSSINEDVEANLVEDIDKGIVEKEEGETSSDITTPDQKEGEKSGESSWFGNLFSTKKSQ